MPTDLNMKFNFRNIVLIIIILFSSSVFMLYGVAKFAGFQFSYHEPDPTLLLKDTRPTHIMWYFFSLKKGYSVLVALGEIIPALLIIFKRTRFLGSLIYLFVVTNVLAINVFFGITPVTLIISIVLFINTLIIIMSERQKLNLLLS